MICAAVDSVCRGLYHRFCRRLDRCRRFTVHDGYRQCGRRRLQRRAINDELQSVLVSFASKIKKPLPRSAGAFILPEVRVCCC